MMTKLLLTSSSTPVNIIMRYPNLSTNHISSSIKDKKCIACDKIFTSDIVHLTVNNNDKNLFSIPFTNGELKVNGSVIIHIEDMDIVESSFEKLTNSNVTSDLSYY